MAPEAAGAVAPSTHVTTPLSEARRRLAASSPVVVITGSTAVLPAAAAAAIVRVIAEGRRVIAIVLGGPEEADPLEGHVHRLLRVPRFVRGSELLAQGLSRLLCRLWAPFFVVSFLDFADKSALFLEWAGATVVKYVTERSYQGVPDADVAATVWNVSGLLFENEASVRTVQERCFALAARSYEVCRPDACQSRSADAGAASANHVGRMLDAMAQDALLLKAGEAGSKSSIKASGAFDKGFACGREGARYGVDKTIDWYLKCSRLSAPRRQGGAGRMVRRPMIGFNPLIFAEAAAGYDETLADPLAEFLDRGRPAGPWTHEVIRIDRAVAARKSQLRVAIHCHFFYEELYPDLVRRLGANGSEVDLYVTTSDRQKVDFIAGTALPSTVTVKDISIVPNRGRDVGAFFSAYGYAQWQDYDVIGHLHGKRCSYREALYGDEWRDFMWTALVGDRGASMDAILSNFSSRPALGLVFPEDPLLLGMDGNRSMAEGLARTLGIAEPLPMHFEFPMGSMYFARPQVLRDLWRLDLDWSDYPDEPIPNDGTILHALERLPTFLAKKAGYHFATAYIEGSYRA